jgi:hypothetical protein
MKGIVNIKQDKSWTLYMGRENRHLGLAQSKWHNPFPMKAEYQRPRCIYDFTDYFIKNTTLLSCLPELDGQVCGCYCRPKVCHCDVIHYVFVKHEEAIKNLRSFIECSDPDTLFTFMTDWRDVSEI